MNQSLLIFSKLINLYTYKNKDKNNNLIKEKTLFPKLQQYFYTGRQVNCLKIIIIQPLL